ncbi:YraN family protein [soil metagenome]
MGTISQWSPGYDWRVSMSFLNKIVGRGKREIGNLAENAAQHYLIEQGLKLVTHNFNCRSGEIDLIMIDKSHLVFIEVRYRQFKAYGSAVESVTIYKQQKVKSAANYYLLQHNLLEKRACRFDIVAVTNSSDGPQFQWIKNAF